MLSVNARECKETIGILQHHLTFDFANIRNNQDVQNNLASCELSHHVKTVKSYAGSAGYTFVHMLQMTDDR